MLFVPLTPAAASPLVAHILELQFGLSRQG